MLAFWTWCLLFISACLSVAYLLLTSILRKRREGEPPIVKGSLIWGNAADFAQHAVEFLHKSAKKYGDVFTIRLINQHLTIIMDPNSYDAVSGEKNFDFDPIQKQVNWNVFSFVLKEPKKMIKDTGKSVRGNLLQRAMENFAKNLEISHDRVWTPPTGSQLITDQSNDQWVQTGIRAFASKTVFDAIFNTVFGRADGHVFNSAMVYKNFDIFHKYFNYFWLGMPKKCFPAAMKSLGELLLMPGADELLKREDLSDYIRIAIGYMREQGQSEADIKGHNLVYLHVNYNTFRLAFWALVNLLENEKARKALNDEISQVIQEHYDPETNSVNLTSKTVESLKVLDSVIQETTRLASGVFMVRYVTDDTMFKNQNGQSFLIRQGDRVAIYPPAIHKDPEIFEDPQTFKYDRFIDTKFYKNDVEVKHPVMGFGTLCPGKRFALLQLKWYILNVMARFDLELLDGENAQYAYEYHGHEILPPVKDVQMRFKSKDSFPAIHFCQ